MDAISDANSTAMGRGAPNTENPNKLVGFRNIGIHIYWFSTIIYYMYLPVMIKLFVPKKAEVEEIFVFKESTFTSPTDDSMIRSDGYSIITSTLRLKTIIIIIVSTYLPITLAIPLLATALIPPAKDSETPTATAVFKLSTTYASLIRSMELAILSLMISISLVTIEIMLLLILLFLCLALQLFDCIL